MKAVILKKTKDERRISPWEAKGMELGAEYNKQLLDFLESHNNDVEGALGSIKAMIRFREDNMPVNSIFERLIPVDRDHEVIIRLFRCIFEALIYGKDLKYQFI